MRNIESFEEKLDEHNVLIFKKPTFYIKKINTKDENKKIMIGVLNKIDNNFIYYKTDHECNIHKKTNSWSLTCKIIEKLEETDIVIIRTSFNIYITSVYTIRNNSKVYYFKEFGFEAKYYTGLGNWCKHNSEEFDANKETIIKQYIQKTKDTISFKIIEKQKKEEHEKKMKEIEESKQLLPGLEYE